MELILVVKIFLKGSMSIKQKDGGVERCPLPLLLNGSQTWSLNNA